MSRRLLVWVVLAGVVLAEICYPLASGSWRARLVYATVVLGFTASVLHAGVTRGPRTAATLVLITTGGGFAVEALGVATGFPFGRYQYGPALGPRPAGVSWVIPFAWTWMAWPAWLVAGRLIGTRRSRPARVARILLAALALATWDLFLDPQMVAQGYWHWFKPAPALPGVADVPLSNYAGWLGVSVILMALLAAGTDVRPRCGYDAPMLALYLWTFASSVLAHAVFLGLPWSALWGGLGMGAVAIPLAVRLWLSRT